jgi:beta-glucosidase
MRIRPFPLFLSSLVLVAATVRAQAPSGLPFQDPRLPLPLRVDDLVTRMTLKEKVSQMQNHARAIPRLGVPAYDWWNEALHGVARNGIATVFPQAIGMAATWNPDLIRDEADIIATEARAKHHEAVRNNQHGIYQGLTFWSPNINIFRDPRWGRGQETYGEDPILTSRIAVAFVRGLQGNDPRYLKVIATPKHYAVHSGPEPARHMFDARPGRRDLYETYLPAFEACITEAGAWSIMGAYNRLEGEACCASSLLLGRILRDAWKFPGYVVSDCGAINDMVAGHTIAANPMEASVMAVKAGCDLTCGNEYESLVEAVQRGLITERDIDVSLHRLMEARFRLGMFDPAESVRYARIPFSANDAPQHDALARRVARESMVLLKNSGNILPLGKDGGPIAVIGPNADELSVLLGNYNGTPSHPVTVLQGIRTHVGPGVTVLFARGCALVEGLPADTASADEALAIAKEARVIVAVMGIAPALEGEEMPVDLKGFAGGDRTDLALPETQQSLLRLLVALGKPLILVVMNGSALALNWEHQNIPAILEAWYPGQQGGNAVADVLFGDYNPAGRLPVTFYKSVDDLPSFDNYAMEGRTYRYFRGEPLFPFGFGLSYTRFEYKKIALSKSVARPGETVRVRATVKNSGGTAGEEVVQVYVRPVESHVPEPIRSLKGFQRAAFKKGETRTIEIPLAVSSFRRFDEASGRYVVDPGNYEIQVGASSSDIRGTAVVRVRK